MAIHNEKAENSAVYMAGCSAVLGDSQELLIFSLLWNPEEVIFNTNLSNRIDKLARQSEDKQGKSKASFCILLSGMPPGDSRCGQVDNQDWTSQESPGCTMARSE